MKYVSLKKIVLVVGKINRKKSFTGWDGALQGPKGWEWSEKVFLIMRGGLGMEQDKTMQGRDDDPILRPHPAPFSSLRQFALNLI